MEAVDWSDPDLFDAAVSRVGARSFAAPAAPTQAFLAETPGFLSSIAGGFQRHNTYLTQLRNTYHLATGAEPEEFDPNFNQYTWMKENLPKETLERLKPEIDAGLFEDSFGPSHVRYKVGSILSEKELIEAEDTNFWGAMIGAMGGTLTDPLAYTNPVGRVKGWWTTGSTAIRIGKRALHSASMAGPQEAALWAQQDLRSWQETLMNLGGASILGGGVAAFSAARRPGHLLNPDNPNNPLRPENLTKHGVRTHVSGEGFDDIAWAPSTAGAAEAPVEAAPRRFGHDPVLRTYATTPAGRALAWTSDTARSFMTKMIDLGGVYTDTNKFLRRTGWSAEDYQLDYTARWLRQTLSDGEQIIRSVHEDLGTLGASQRRTVVASDVNAATQRRLTQTSTPEFEQALVARYGAEGAARITRGAEQYAARIERTHADQAREMKELGMIRDDAKVDKLKAERDKLRQQKKETLEKEQETFTNAKADIETRRKATKTLEAAEKAAAREKLDKELRDLKLANDIKLREVREMFDDAKITSDLDHELGLAPDLGKDYGHAQLWEPDAIATTMEGFRNFLHRILADNPDADWLLNVHNLTPTEWKGLAEFDPLNWARIRQEWSGDEQGWKLARAQQNLEEARVREKEAKLDLSDVLRALGLLERRAGQAEVSEYGRYRDMLNTQRAAATAERDVLAKEARAFIEAATAARQKGLDRLFEFDDGVGPRSAKQRWEERLGVQQDPEKTFDFVRQAARVEKITSQLSKAEAKVRELTKKQSAMERAFADARDTTARRKDLKRAYAEVKTEMKDMRDLSSRNVGQLERAVSRTAGRKPLDDAIDDIIANLTHKGRMPASSLEGIIPEGGRFKERRLVLTPEQKIEAQEAGWLRTDLPNILSLEARQIAGRLSLARAFDIGRGKAHESWQDVEKALNQDYERLIASHPAQAPVFRNEQRRALKDLRGLRDRILGRLGDNMDRDEWLNWMSRNVRQYNFIRYGVGFLISAQNDIAAVALRHKVLPLLRDQGKEAFNSVLHFPAPNASEFAHFISSLELGVNASLLSQRIDEGNLFRQQQGIGAPGSMKQRVTGAIDRGGLALSEFVVKLSGVQMWDRFWKYAAGLQLSNDLRMKAGRWSQLSDREKMDWAALGIGEREAARIHRYSQQYGTIENGRWDPNWEKWYATQDGAEAARDMRLAINRDANRSKSWPGVGNRPLFYDTWWGALLGQFTTFMHSFTDRYIASLVQKGLYFPDVQAASSFAFLMGTGAFIMTLKDLQRGITPAERWNFDDPSNPNAAFDTAWEILDRSGVFGWTSPYIDIGMKMAGLGGASRYAREGWMGQLAGINGALIGDTSRFINELTAQARGDKPPEMMPIAKKMAALAPFSTIMRSFTHLYDD